MFFGRRERALGFLHSRAAARITARRLDTEEAMQKTLYVSLDVHKASISASTAEEDRNGPVNFVGAIANTPAALKRLAERLAKDGHRLEFCYEAGGCGYGIYRHLTELGHGCTVVATSMIPRASRASVSGTIGGTPKSLQSCIDR
jgi:hypothetical protein